MSEPKPVGVTSIEIATAKPLGEPTIASAKPVGELTALIAKPVGVLVEEVPEPVGVVPAFHHQSQDQSQHDIQFTHACTCST